MQLTFGGLSMRAIATAALAAILSGCATITADTVDNYSTSSLCSILYSGSWTYNYEEEKVMRQALEDRGQVCRQPTPAERVANAQARAQSSANFNQSIKDYNTWLRYPQGRQTTCKPGLPDIWGNVSYTCSQH